MQTLSYRKFYRSGDGSEITYDEIVHPISAGRDDTVQVYIDGDALIVMCQNAPLDYVGIEVFCDNEIEPTNDLFLQSEDQILNVLGPRGLDLLNINIVKRMYHRIRDIG